MDASIVFSRKSGTKAGKELVGRSTVDDPDLVLFLPTTVEVTENGVKDTVDVLTAAYDCPVTGVSHGGFATAETDGFELFGSCMVAVQNVSFTADYVDNVWTASADDLVELLTGYDGTVLTCESGSRAGGSSAGWKLLQRLSRRIVTRDSFGQRQRLINEIQNTLPKYRLGWSPLFLARMQELKQGAQVVNFSSCDTGDMVDGYEIWNDRITNSQAAAVLSMDDTLSARTVQTAEETLEHGQILESFDNLGFYNDVIYRFGDRTFHDLCDEYPIGLTVGRGGFMHYFLLETGDTVYASPASSDLGVVVSPIPVNADTRAHLVRAPAFDQYREHYRQALKDAGPQPHISLNPPQMDCYRDSLSRLVDVTAAEHDSFLITVDNAFRQLDTDYNYPSVLTYS